MKTAIDLLRKEAYALRTYGAIQERQTGRSTEAWSGQAERDAEALEFAADYLERNSEH